MLYNVHTPLICIYLRRTGMCLKLDFSVDSPHWTAIAPLPTPVKNFGFVASGRKIFAIGGGKADFTKSNKVSCQE